MSITSRSYLLFGKIVSPDRKHALKICVDRYEMTERLLMYFKNKTMVYAHETNLDCKPGDYVLIKESNLQNNKGITHTIEKVLYRLGNFIDPLTGKKCAGPEFLDDIERTSQLFGMQPPFLKSNSEKGKEES